MCILLVEDETLIRDVMRESLEEAGHEVMALATATDAIEAIEHRHRPFSVLVTDLHLNGTLTGLDVADAMRAHFPAVPVVLATGRPDVLGVEHGTFTLLAKPYGIRDLIRTVETVRA